MLPCHDYISFGILSMMLAKFAAWQNRQTEFIMPMPAR